ncbi:hypothetical protein OS493_023472 [Desmophyllum pertusum]|uniref:Carboxylesterase type B domain-containing protein n=1 Tax=Desmophyllum pertusum TaxID=174260 RepID=A0A9W9ZQI0_9CNID|nr:hypothetical protein OS493_023472 [Desmophyllum pertusum]
MKADPILIGLLNGLFGMTESVDNGVSPSFFKEFITALAHARNTKKETADLIADALEFMYTPWPDNSDKYALRNQLIDLIGDYNFVAPSHEVADIHSQHAPVLHVRVRSPLKERQFLS